MVVFMPVFRVEKNQNYTTMCNHHLRDQKLSLKGKGLLSMLLSLPDTWNYSVRGLAAIVPDGVDGVMTALKELEQLGYLERHQLRAANGRLGKVEYAFIVSTHVDKAHIHNHIIYNSVSLDCERKFKDFFLSARALQKVSDRICLAHGLSVIEPKSYRERNTQNPYAGKSSQRIKLCQTIERVLEEKPKNFREFVKLLEAEGYAYKSGKHAAFRKSGAKRYIRLDSLPQGYREQEILEKLESTIIAESEKKKQYRQSENSLSMLIDIQEKLRSGKGAGYERWAKVFNLKQMVNTMEFLKENHLESLEELTERTREVTEQYHTSRDTIRQCDDRLKEIGEMKKQIVSYVKTREIYQRYRKSGRSKKFLEKHREEIAIHMAAKKFFDESGLKKLPKVKELSVEYTEVLEKKREAYKNYRTYQEEMKTYQIAEKTVKTILEKDTEDTRTERETASAER